MIMIGPVLPLSRDQEEKEASELVSSISGVTGDREHPGKYAITHIWNLTCGTDEPIYRKKKKKNLMDLEKRLVVAKGEAVGVGWIGSWWLVDANYCTEILLWRTGSSSLVTCDGTGWRITGGKEHTYCFMCI